MVANAVYIVYDMHAIDTFKLVLLAVGRCSGQ